MSSFPTSPQPLKTYTFSGAFRTLITESEFGYEQRRPIWHEPKKLFRLQYDVLNNSEMTTLSNFFYNTASGMYNTFDYVDRDSVTYNCRFTNDELTFEEFRNGYYRCSIELTEVF